MTVLPCAQELRFLVYCQLRGYLPAADYPNGRETDKHDADASHFYEYAADQVTLLGYVRLVRPDVDGRFPFQDRCPLHMHVTLPPALESREVSRLVVSPDLHDPTAVLEALYRQMYQFSCAIAVRFWHAAMQIALARKLARQGFEFATIGPKADYYGQVNPYLLDLRVVEREVDAQTLARFKGA